MAYQVYLLECSDKSFYCGYSSDLNSRIEAHNRGTASKYTRGKRPVKLVYSEKSKTQKEAMQREKKIKKMSRKDKIGLIRKE